MSYCYVERAGEKNGIGIFLTSNFLKVCVSKSGVEFVNFLGIIFFLGYFLFFLKEYSYTHTIHTVMLLLSFLLSMKSLWEFIMILRKQSHMDSKQICVHSMCVLCIHSPQYYFPNKQSLEYKWG